MGINILITGGSGVLGSELIKGFLSLKQYNILHPTSTQMNITQKYIINEFFQSNKIDLVIHCAALKDVGKIEKDPEEALEVNVIGTINLLNECIKRKIKMVYISTDYVFDGKKGNYSINDPINPLSKYAKTKAASEILVSMEDRNLIIRTSFYGRSFPFDKACINRWSSKDYVDIISLKIIESIIKEKSGIIHIGSEKRSLYQIAINRKPDVKPYLFDIELDKKIPIDTSLNLERTKNES